MRTKQGGIMKLRGISKIILIVLLLLLPVQSAISEQHSFTVANGTGIQVREGINSALQALASTSTGPTAPTAIFRNQLWADNSSGYMKIRSSDNTTWITLWPLATGPSNVSIASWLQTLEGNDNTTAVSPADLTSKMDNDTSLAGDNNSRIPTQHAVKTFALPASYLDTDGTLAANSDVKVASQKAVKTYVASQSAGAPVTSSAWKNALNLKAYYASAATVTVTADEVIIPDNTTSRKGKMFLSVNVTPSMSVAGCNGFDNGTPADVASTWYHIWLAGHDNGSICGLLSASASAPTLPAGYAYQSYVGPVYNNSGGNFDTFLQYGNYVLNGPAQVLSAGTQTSYTSISLATIIPPTAKSIVYSIQGGAASKTSWVASDSSGVYYQRLYWDNANQLLVGNQEIILSTPQTIWYKVASGGSLTIDTIGYRL